MNRISHGYDLVRNTFPSSTKEIDNSESSFEYHVFFTKAISDMVIASATLVLPPGIRPTIVSPLGVVPILHFDKLRLIVKMRYVDEHIVKRVFKFEDLSDSVDMSN